MKSSTTKLWPWMPEDLTVSEKLVLLALIELGANKVSIQASLKDLAKMLDLSEAGVRITTKALRMAGHISGTPGAVLYNGVPAATVWTLNLKV